MKHDVLVLCGGLSHERDVSLRSGRRVATALRKVGHRVVESDLEANIFDKIADLDSPVIFPLLHGGLGEDGSIQSVLKLLGLPRVGTRGSRAKMVFNKAIAVPLARDGGLLTPKQISLPQDIFRTLGTNQILTHLAQYIGFPMMIKPAESGSSLGANRVDRIEDIPQAMVSAYAYGTLNVIEEFIPGTEVAITVLDLGDGPTALPAVEIRPLSGSYDYEARYTPGQTRFVTPAELSEESTRKAANLALAAHRLFGLRDLSRADIIIRPDGQPVLLEVNVAPGMSETSLVPLAFDASGLDLGEVCSQLVEQAAIRFAAQV